MRSIELTGAGLIRVLSASVEAGTDAALRRRAERLADEFAAAGDVEAARQAPGDYAVTVSAPGLFGREFGTVATPAEPVVAPALTNIARRRP